MMSHQLILRFLANILASLSALAVLAVSPAFAFGGRGLAEASSGGGAAFPAPAGGSTLVTLTSSQNASGLGQVVTFTATVFPVSPATGTPTGTVMLMDGGIAISSGALRSSTATFTTSALAAGKHTITVSYGGDSNFTGSTGSLTGNAQVVEPPSIAEAFSPAGIQPNGVSTLTITITNPAANSVALTGVAFTDSFPTNVVVATPNGLTNTCGGTATATAGSGSLSLTGGTVAVNSSCTVAVNVTSSSTGSYPNSTGPVSSTNGGTGNTGSATLAVANPPTISKLFLPNSSPNNEPTLLSFTIENPNSNSSPPNSDLALTGISFTDALPAGLVVATPNNLSNSCGGTVTATPGSSAVTLTGGSLGAAIGLIAAPGGKKHPRRFGEIGPQSAPESDGECFISVSVQPSVTGGLNNTTGPISANESGLGATSNTATLTVTPAPSAPMVSKAFSGATMPLGGVSTLTFTFTNPNAGTAFIQIGVTDMLPSGLVVANPNAVTGTCVTSDGGSVTANPGSHSITIGPIILQSSSSCEASVNVTAVSTGEQNNVSGNVSASFDDGSGTFVPISGGAASASITVLGPPTIAKAFANTQIVSGGATSLKFTLSNPNSSSALNGVQFSDSFPAGLVVASTPNISDGCGGTFTATAGASSVSLTGGTIPASGVCTITVAVTVSSSSVVHNTTGAVNSTNGGAGTVSNTATIEAFNECLKDDTTGDVLEWSSTTGAYMFTHCATGFTLSGTGTPTFVNGSEDLSDSEAGRKVTAAFNTGSLTGHAVIAVQVAPGITQTYTINQTKTHITCSCTN
jgi:hypothetical protein